MLRIDFGEKSFEFGIMFHIIVERGFEVIERLFLEQGKFFKNGLFFSFYICQKHIFVYIESIISNVIRSGKINHEL